MSALEPAQHELLRRIVGAGDGDYPITAAEKPLLAALIKRGVLISVPKKGGPSRLMITDLGRELLPRSIADEKPADATPNAPEDVTPAPQPKGKLDTLIALLSRPEGATIADMMQASGWQAHSVRGALAGAIKKARGLNVISEKVDGVRLYRTVNEAAA